MGSLMCKLKMNFALFTATNGFLREDTCVRQQGMAVQLSAVECVATQVNVLFCFTEMYMREMWWAE